MNQPRAVVEIGSTGIRLLVAELNSDNKFNILDRAEQPVNIGRDVFTNGVISRETLLLCLKILLRFKEQLLSWGITAAETVVVGTSAVREASNRDPVVDRINVKTGFTVRVIDGLEENRLMYIAVTECLKDEEVSVRRRDSIILEINGASTEMMLMENGRMVGAHTLRLGTVIIEQNIRALTGSMSDARRFVDEFINNTHNVLSAEMSFANVKQFIALGNDMKLVALFAGKPVSSFLWKIARNDFERFIDDVIRYTPEECVAKFKINYNDVNTFLISLIAYKQFVSLTQVQEILVPETSLREGLLFTSAGTENDAVRSDFESQIFASASTLLRKYNGDEKHAEFVRDVSLKLYDALEKELGLEKYCRTLLQVSAILHDVGMFIRAEDHNIHSKYIISHSEIFGLSHEDRLIVAMITCFHKGAKRPQDDPEFKPLARSIRMKILKLSAILRVADAMDRSHHQNLSDFTVNFAQDSITLRVKGHHNLSLEKLALKEKGDLFENVFGYKLVLV
ncbi:MAG: phosphatase [Treponema sp.]|nr:phosphatase [Treponema sp.]